MIDDDDGRSSPSIDSSPSLDGSLSIDEEIETTIDTSRVALLGPTRLGGGGAGIGIGPDWGGLEWTSPYDTAGQIVAIRDRSIDPSRDVGQTPDAPAPAYPAAGDPRSPLPPVDDLISPRRVRDHGHRRVAHVAREVLAESRQAVEMGKWMDRRAVEQSLDARLGEGLRPIINATGDLTPHRLGRAPWSPAAMAAVGRVAGYCAVDPTRPDAGLSAGVESRLCALTGAESALVVNNRAAAVMLMLAATVRDGREVLVSRGELVDVDGEYRVPQIIALSGVPLREVGTTNRTLVADYTDALLADQSGRAERARIGAILRVHDDGFRQVGYVERPDLSELVGHGVPLLVDQGNGEPRHDDIDNPSVAAAIAAGASAVCFSGDRLLGGPQAGLVVGRTRFINAMRRHPLYRALRVGKVTLAALEATLDDHLCQRRLPLETMREASLEELRVAVEHWAAVLGDKVPCRVITTEGTVGRPGRPGRTWPSVALAIQIPQLNELVAALARGRNPVVGRIESDELLLDARAVVPNGHANALLATVEAALDAVLGGPILKGPGL